MAAPIQLTPNMDANTLVQTINANFRQIESESRTKVVKDEDGVNRVLIGRAPKGDYVVAITIKGKNVVEELER